MVPTWVSRCLSKAVEGLQQSRDSLLLASPGRYSSRPVKHHLCHDSTNLPIVLYSWLTSPHRSQNLTQTWTSQVQRSVPASCGHGARVSQTVSHQPSDWCQRSLLHRRFGCPRNEPASFSRLIAALRSRSSTKPQVLQ